MDGEAVWVNLDASSILTRVSILSFLETIMASSLKILFAATTHVLALRLMLEVFVKSLRCGL